MDVLSQLLDVFLHLDTHLNDWAGALGPWLYVVLSSSSLRNRPGIAVSAVDLPPRVGRWRLIDGSPSAPARHLTLTPAVLGDASITDRLSGRGRVKISIAMIQAINGHCCARNAWRKYGGKMIIIARFMLIIRTSRPSSLASAHAPLALRSLQRQRRHRPGSPRHERPSSAMPW
jgi:membrane-associated protein